MNVLFLYNPKSGAGNFAEDLDYVVKRFQIKGQQIVPYRMIDLGDLKKFMEKMDFRWIHKIIIAGGDGTIHQVVNLLMNLNVDLPIAIFPTGTANDFSQNFNIPKDLDGMIDVAISNNTVPCDLGKVNSSYFINVASFGNLVDISQRVNDQAKNVLGVLAYYIKGIEEIPKLKSITAKFESDNYFFEDKIFFALIMNGVSAGGFRKLAPRSEINDGLLDVVIFKKCPIYELMPLLIKVVSGEHPNSNHIEYIQTKNIKITSDEPIGSDLDGEAGPHLPLEISVLKHQLKIIASS